LAKLSKNEQAIEECLEKARKDVTYAEEKKKQKEQEIQSLD
jgi:hypothetical protein